MRISPDHAGKSDKSSSENKAPTKSRKKAAREDSDSDAGPAADVKLSSKAKAAQTETKKAPEAPAPTADKEITSAEILMEHVNKGKLSGQEQEMAMKRIGEIVKKYGNA